MSKLGERHFYLLCVLPGLEAFGGIPPVNKQELSFAVRESKGPVDVVQTLLLSDDLLQREAVLSGEIGSDYTDLTVLSLQQVKDSEPLPDFLLPDREEGREPGGHPIETDRVWEKYFQHAAEVAHSTRTPFLKAWVGFEVGLRNALVKARAEALQRDPGPYMVAQGLGDREVPFGHILAGWKGASNPLEALEALDRARWDWVTEHDKRYGFSDDEVAAYTAKWLILQRSRRMFCGGMESMMMGNC